MMHVVEKHLTSLDDLPSLPLELWATTHISKAEEKRMGISDPKTTQWRDQYQVLDSDDIALIEHDGEYDDEVGDSDVTEQGFRYSVRDYGPQLEGGDSDERQHRSESRKRAFSAASTSSRQGSPTKKHQSFYFQQ
jgi:hypothetical protein